MNQQYKRKCIPASYSELPHGHIEYENDDFTYCMPTPLMNEGVFFDNVELVF